MSKSNIMQLMYSLSDRKIKEAVSYWQRYLEGYEQQTSIPKSFICSNEDEYISMDFDIEIDEDITNKLKNLSAKNGITVDSIFKSAWGVLLRRYNNVDDAVFGAVVLGVNPLAQEVKNYTKPFTNIVPVRIKSSSSESFINLAREIEIMDSKSALFRYLPLCEIESTTVLKSNLIDSAILIEKETALAENKNLGDRFKLDFALEEELEETNYNFKIGICISNKVEIRVIYNGNVYAAKDVKFILSHFKNIIKEIVDNPHKKISEVEMISQEEKEKLLLEFNNTKVDYEKEKTICELFEAQVEKTPDNIALIYKDKTMTYRELNNRANQLAVTLREKGVGPDKIVGIMLEQSLEMIVGIMAILKSGGAYVPIDVKYPQERIEYILKDSGTSILLTKSGIASKNTFSEIIIETDNEDVYAKDCSNLKKINNTSDLAYVIYTSGTTGKPKGVMIEHRNLVKYMNSFFNEFDLNASDVMLQQASICFDTSIEEIYPILLVGGKLVLEDRYNLLNKEYLKETLDRNKVTIVSCAPHIFNKILELDYQGNLRILISGGDKLNLKLENYSNKKCRLYNTFGPTEATVCASYYEITDRTIDNIPIGKPIANTRIYIVDKNNKIQPIGIPGELCISGDGLARGYLNRPDLTALKFIYNPYEDGQKMYKTGDLARWLPDGNIEFMGRIDYQVKIRGFRIELGEIENQLLKHPQIKEAVVIDRDDKQGNKYLCAYVVEDNELTVTQLREHLSKELPEYMVPTYFIQLEKIPLTVNGKVDRKSLPEPDKDINTGVEYVPPRNELEENIVDIWKKVLGVKKIGIGDNFFDLGGHSLKALELASKLNSIDIPLKVSEVYKYPTIRSLAQFIHLENSNLKFKEEVAATEVLDFHSDSNIIKGITSNDDKYSWEELDCFNRTVAIIFKYFKKELFDLFVFNISYYSSFMADNELVGAIEGGNDDVFMHFYNKILYNKFKIKISKVEFSTAEEMHAKIKESIDNDIPVLVPGDLYGLYYYSMYRTSPHMHYFIIKGYDSRREIYNILDNMHINNGSGTIYKDFTIRFTEIYEMNKLYLEHFDNQSKNTFFWTISNENKQGEYYDIHKCILDHCSYLEEVNKDNSKVKYLEYEIVKRIEEAEEISEEKVKKLIGDIILMINCKPTYYDLTFKFLEKLNVPQKDILKLKEMYKVIGKNWNAIRFNVLDNVVQKNYDFREIKKFAADNMEREKAYRESLIDIVKNIDGKVKEATKQKIFFNNYEFEEFNNNNAKIIIGMDQIEFTLDADKTYDIWTTEDNGPQVLNKVSNNERFDIECKLNINLNYYGRQALFHDGIIIKLTHGISILFGIVKEEQEENKLAIYCPQRGDNYDIFEMPYINKEQIYLKIGRENSTYSFYYKESAEDKWNNITNLELKQYLNSTGFFSKKWQSGKHSVEISEIFYSKN